MYSFETHLLIQELHQTYQQVQQQCSRQLTYASTAPSLLQMPYGVAPHVKTMPNTQCQVLTAFSLPNSGGTSYYDFVFAVEHAVHERFNSIQSRFIHAWKQAIQRLLHARGFSQHGTFFVKNNLRISLAEQVGHGTQTVMYGGIQIFLCNQHGVIEKRLSPDWLRVQTRQASRTNTKTTPI